MKKVIINILIVCMVLTYVPFTSIYAEEQKTSVFYDDFENGDAFWNYGSSQFMRTVDGELVSDSDSDSLTCIASLRGETTKCENFVMDTVFETDTNNGWFGILIRQESVEEAGLHFVIKDDCFYTTPAPVSSSSGDNRCYYSFKDGISYLFRIIAEGTKITVKIKPADAEDFEQEWTATFENSGEGAFEFRSYMAMARIDSVKITEIESGEVYYPNKFLKVLAGGTISAVPEFTEGFEADSITYSCSGDSFTVDANGTVTAKDTSVGNGYGVITATAVKNGTTYTASCDIARTIPLQSLGDSKEYVILAVGETMNLTVSYTPSNATNKDLIWESADPDSVEIVGNTEGARGIRAIKPAKLVRVVARSRENPSVKSEWYVTVEGNPSEIKVQEFNPNGYKRKIPYGMLGVSDVHTYTTVDSVKDYQEFHFPYWRDMKLQQFRSSVSGIDLETGNILGASGLAITAADIFKTANELDVPVNLSLGQNFDTAEEIIKLAQEIRKVTDKEICFGIWEECYDGRMSSHTPWPVNRVEDYTNFLKEIYPEVKEAFPDGSVKIGATIIDYASYQGFGNGVGTATTNMLGTWNHYVAEAKDYYDAVAIHHYSGHRTTTTKSVMRSFSVDSACLADGLKIQAGMFPDKEFWVNEWGDLPLSLLFREPFPSNQARNQYMKSLGNAMGYLQRVMEMTLDENVTMSAYHGYNDQQGFGMVQGEVKLPAYYMFSQMGDIFSKYSHIYGMNYSKDTDLHFVQDMSELRSVPSGQYMVNASLVNAWGFGDESDIQEVLFQNSSEYYIKVYVPGYKLDKLMSYGNGENPLPDLAVNPNTTKDAPPSYIPVPEYYSGGEYENYILMPPYSVIRAEVESVPVEAGWQTIFADNFSGDMSKWIGSESHFVLQEDGTLRLYGHGATLQPCIDAEKDFMIEFDAIGWQSDGIMLKFTTDNTAKNFELHLPNMDVTTGYNTGIYLSDGSASHYVTGGIYAGTLEAPKKFSVRIILQDGDLQLYIKYETDSDYTLVCTFSQLDSRDSKIIDANTIYIPSIYQVRGQLTDSIPTYIDNVKIKGIRKMIDFTVLGTPEIKPEYELAFSDDFSGTLNSGYQVTLLGKLSDKWSLVNPVNLSCSRTTDGQLAILGHNGYLVPTADVASDNFEIEYDFCGSSNSFLFHFENAEDSSDYFRLRCMDGLTQVYDESDNIHSFGGGIQDDVWQSIKISLKDGILDVGVKGTDETEFKYNGMPYSHIWYNANDENASFIEKGVKYNVKVYIWYSQDKAVLLDNFKIRRVNTEVSEIVKKDGVNAFELNDIEVKVKTDDGYELTSYPIKGAENRFRIKSEALSGGSISGKAVLAIYDGDRLYNVVTCDMSEETEASVFIPHTLEEPDIRLMLWDGFTECTPMTSVINY